MQAQEKTVCFYKKKTCMLKLSSPIHLWPKEPNVHHISALHCCDNTRREMQTAASGGHLKISKQTSAEVKQTGVTAAVTSDVQSLKVFQWLIADSLLKGNPYQNPHPLSAREFGTDVILLLHNNTHKRPKNKKNMANAPIVSRRNLLRFILKWGQE